MNLKRIKNRRSFEKRVKDFEVLMQWVEIEFENATGGDVDNELTRKSRRHVNDISGKHPNVMDWINRVDHRLNEL